MIEGLIRNGTQVAVVTLICCLIGIVAAFRLPVQMIPDLAVRTISIETSWPDATPQDIEKEILLEQEQYLRSIPSLERMISWAWSGGAAIELEFPFHIDLNETLIRVNNALSQVPSYPENVDQPHIYASSFSENAFMYFTALPLPGNPRGVDMDMMDDFIDDNVRTRLERVSGVSRVNISGGQERQVHVYVDPAAIAERNLTLSDVRSALLMRNRDVSGGEIEGGKRRYLLRTIGRFPTVDSLKELIIVRRGDTLVRLGDVAQVKLGHAKVRARSFLNRDPVIMLSVRRESGSNVIAIKKAMLAEVEAVNREVLKPEGLTLKLVSDDVVYVDASFRNVWIDIVLGGLLATAVLYLFLRTWPITLVAALGIPVCTIAALLGLYLTGRTINVISLAGVAFAIGMTIDNTIVVIESIAVQRMKGLGGLSAAVEGVRQVWAAVLSSTLTTIMVFIPILFIEQEAGQLYSDIAIGISASIFASMLVSVTIVPAAAARLSEGRNASEARRVPGAAARGTLALVGWILDTRQRSMAGIVATLGLGAGIIFFLLPPAEYLPDGEEPKIFATMNAPPGYNFSAMEKIARELQDELMNFVGDDPDRFESGETDMPALAYIMVSYDAESVRVMTAPIDHGRIADMIKAVDRRYKRYPGMQSFVSRGSIITSNDGGARSINLDISGPRLRDIFQTATLAYQRAEEIFPDVRIQADPPTLVLSQPMIEVRPNWERAAELNLTTDQLGFTVAALTDGAFAGYFYLNDKKLDIYFYNKITHSGGATPTAPEDLGRIPIYTPQGAMLPLAAIAEIRETVDTNSIRRVNGKRTLTLSIIPPATIALETGIDMVRRQLVRHLQDQGKLPEGITMGLSGASDQLEATKQAMAGNFVIAILIVYLLLVAVFSHWGHPLLIMTTIPLGVAGGLLGLYLLNGIGALLPLAGIAPIAQPFDMISMLGFLILMGTVVNNPILIVERAYENVHKQGMAPRAAVMEAVSTRLRPIVMTTLTTTIGLAPLVVIPGEGTELYRGVGAIVLFGMLSTAFVTLTFLPALTMLTLERNSRSCDRKRKRAEVIDAGRISE